jgi:hypothetical protein
MDLDRLTILERAQLLRDATLRWHGEILEGLARLLAAQHDMQQEQRELTQRVTLAIESIDQTLTQQAAFNADVRTILARIETLMTRKLPTGDNGREA